MNREIKFRVWDTELNIFIGNLGMKTNNVLTDGTEKRFNVMQYTGFKDENGKDIYQGDIAKMWLEDTVLSEGGYYYWPLEVKWHNGCWCIVDPGCSYKHNMPTLLYEVCSEIIIVGNIYENPELLKP